MKNVSIMEQLNAMAAQIEAAQIALTTQNTKLDYDEVSEQFIKENQEGWKETGQYYRSLRTSQGLTQEYVANALGCSASKISKFENGLCINNAKLLENAYRMYLAINKEVNDISNIESYVDSVMENIDMVCQDHEPDQQTAILRAIKNLYDYLFVTQIKLSGTFPMFGSFTDDTKASFMETAMQLATKRMNEKSGIQQ